MSIEQPPLATDTVMRRGAGHAIEAMALPDGSVSSEARNTNIREVAEHIDHGLEKLARCY